jgi:hypothetical protein
MSKSYIQVKDDLADSAAVVTYTALAENAPNYGKGTIIIALDGSATIIIDDAGLGKLMTVAV